MEIVKAFHDNTLSHEITICTIDRKYYFKASDIGIVLGLANIRENLRTIKEEYKLVRKIDTIKGQQDSIFLSEKGLYHVLMRSNKPIAVIFQDWVLEVIEKIRETGEYKLKKELELRDEELKEKEEEIKEKENKLLQITQKLEDVSAENDILKVVDNIPIIYVYNTDITQDRPLLKIGVTQQYRTRIKPYKQTHPHGRVVYHVEIPDAYISLKTFEHWIHTMLKNHLVRGEMFDISVEEAKSVIVSQLLLLKCTNVIDDTDRLTKFHKIVDSNSQIIDNTDPKVSTRTIATQTEEWDEELDTTTKKQDEITDKFDEFIKECCNVNEDVEVRTVDIAGQYRIWSQAPSKDVYFALLNYLKVNFRPIRVSEQNGETVVNGYRGVELKEIIYRQDPLASEPSMFVFAVCKFAPGAKILFKELAEEYLSWKKRNEKSYVNYERELKKWLNSCEFVCKSNIWTSNGNGSGYYGITLLSEGAKVSKTSSTAKKVQKRTIDSETILNNWTTIAKAADDEGISAAKMSRCIKARTPFDGGYYYCCSEV
jgi:prophage antirepressor-like protein